MARARIEIVPDDSWDGVLGELQTRVVDPGETPYRGGFISQYFVKPFYAPGLSPGGGNVLLVVVVVWCLSWLLYAAVGKGSGREESLHLG